MGSIDPPPSHHTQTNGKKKLFKKKRERHSGIGCNFRSQNAQKSIRGPCWA